MKQPLAILLFLIFSIHISGQIEGPLQVCKYDCETYIVSDSAFVIEIDVENADYIDLNPNGDLIGEFELCFNYDSPARHVID